jgi:hypothetical protein
MTADMDVRTAIFGVAGLVGGLGAFFWGLRCYQRKRLLQNTPTSKVDAVALGLAELCGRAVPHESMTSPIEQLPCVYWKYKVEEYREMGKQKGWITIDSGEKRVPFYLEDDTGKILVIPLQATIDIPKTLEVEPPKNPLKTEAPARVLAFAAEKAIELDGVFISQKRFTEWMITAGDTLFVFGPVMALEDDGAGGAKVGSRIVCQDGKHPFFFIANRSARAVELEFEGKAALGVIGGGLLAVVALGILLAVYFHRL